MQTVSGAVWAGCTQADVCVGWGLYTSVQGTKTKLPVTQTTSSVLWTRLAGDLEMDVTAWHSFLSLGRSLVV